MYSEQARFPRPDDAAEHTEPEYGILLLISGALGLFCVFQYYFPVDSGPTYGNIACLLAICFAGSKWSISGLPAAFNVVIGSLNGCCTFYLLASRATYDPGFSIDFLNNPWFPIILGLIAFFVPSFAVWPPIAMQWSKAHIAAETGWGSLGGADYIIVPDLTILLALMLAVLALSRTAPRILLRRSFDVETEKYCAAAIVIAAGVHLSNYFYSGIAKVFLRGAEPLTWVLHNKTYFLSLHASHMGFLTIQNILKGLGFHVEITRILVLLNEPINMAVLIGQLSALACLMSIKKAARLTAFFDFMHVGIFLLSGIFFWKWIVLNVAFIFSFAQLRKRCAPNLSVRLYGCAVVGLAPLAFHIVQLAWFDTGAVNEWTFKAVTMDGHEIDIPSNFFLDSSVDVAQQRFAHPRNGFLPTGTWGTTGDGAIMSAIDRNCRANVQNFTISDMDLARVKTLIDRQRLLVLKLSDAEGHISYDTYPHHIWSAPWLVQDFTQINLRSLKTYRLVVQSFCVDVGSDGQIQRTPVGRTTYDFPPKM